MILALVAVLLVCSAIAVMSAGPILAGVLVCAFVAGWCARAATAIDTSRRE